VAWDISTATYIKGSFVSGASNGTGIFIRGDGGGFDGKYIYIMSSGDDTIYAYVLTNAWDIGAKSALTNINVGVQVPLPYGLFFKPDGSRFYIAEDQTGSVNNVNQWDTSSPWFLGSASYAGFASTVLQNTGPRDIWFKPDGLKMYATNVVDGIVQEYDLSTDWDVTTASYSNVSLDVGAGGITPNGIFMRDDGRKMYIVDSVTDTIHEYNM
jgi:DNA-binding beta-propeller fold protein YncE